MHIRSGAARRGALRLFLSGILALMVVGSGCAANYRITNQQDFLTYDRPFTDASAEASRKDADTICRDRSRVALLISDVCDLTRCFTNYQCVTKAELPVLIR